MKRCGGIPESSMNSYVKTIEKAREQDLMLAKSHEENAQAREEIAHLRSVTTSRESEIEAQAQEIAQLKAS